MRCVQRLRIQLMQDARAIVGRKTTTQRECMLLKPGHILQDRSGRISLMGGCAGGEMPLHGKEVDRAMAIKPINSRFAGTFRVLG